jgi:hypothetical protein
VGKADVGGRHDQRDSSLPRRRMTSGNKKVRAPTGGLPDYLTDDLQTSR